MAWNTNYPTGIAEYASWDDVIALSPSDGDEMVFMGMKWVYLGASSVWLPEEIYNGTPADLRVIEGTEANDAALIANGWSITKNGAGNTSYDGTRVTISQETLAGDNCTLFYTPVGTVNKFIYGRVRVTTAPTQATKPDLALVLRDAARTYIFDLHAGSTGDFPVFISNTSGIHPNCSYDKNVTALNQERFYLYVLKGVTPQIPFPTLYVVCQGFGTSPICTVSESASWPASGGVLDTVVGAAAGVDRGVMQVRNVVAGTFS